MVTIRIPAPTPGLGSNIMGVLGLAAIVFAISALTDWRWGVLVGGIFVVGLVALGQNAEAQQAAVQDKVGEARERRHRRAG